MPPQIDGKVALITGGSRGIGRAMAQRLSAAGATVVVTARSLDKSATASGTLAETVALIEAAGGKAIPIGCDLEDGTQRDSLVSRTIEAAGRLDILINNAGIADYSPVESMPLAVFDRTVDHYLRTPFLLAQKAIPVMRAQGAGWIVNVGSVTGLPARRPFSWQETEGGMAVYSAVKAALNRFTESLAAELLPDNIAVNMVGPSTAISTPGADRYIPSDYPTEDIAYIAETALQLCLLPAAERTGELAYSLHYPLKRMFPVYDLSGKAELARPTAPAEAHPLLDLLSGRNGK